MDAARDMRSRRYFAVGTRPDRTPSVDAELAGQAVVELVRTRDQRGLWGGPDSLDILISTTHAAMTLMAAGVPPTGDLVNPALRYLGELDTRRHTTFYWRSGPLLNVDGFEDIVAHDIEYLLKHLRRAAGNPDYPAFFFLMKLLRFSEIEYPERQANIERLANQMLDEWTPDLCWYGRSSISSMGLALLCDTGLLPGDVVSRTTDFLLRLFDDNDGRRFADNPLDDAFTVYNLYERHDAIQSLLPAELWRAARTRSEGLRSELFVPQEPPFGGAVDSPAYGVAVVSRALMARGYAEQQDFDLDLAMSITRTSAERIHVPNPASSPPFWGNVPEPIAKTCFVLMPFGSDRRTEIYLEYVKRPLESLGLSVARADDMFGSKPIMSDVWRGICSASIVVADLSDKNPNVFYELGIAHVLGRPVVLISERIEDVPFDLRSVRVIVYGDSPGSWRSLAESVVSFARAELET